MAEFFTNGEDGFTLRLGHAATRRPGGSSIAGPSVVLAVAIRVIRSMLLNSLPRLLLGTAVGLTDERGFSLVIEFTDRSLEFIRPGQQ